MNNYLYRVFNDILPIELITIIKKHAYPPKNKNQPCCVFCKGSVSYYEYIDGAGYVCNICAYGL